MGGSTSGFAEASGSATLSNYLVMRGDVVLRPTSTACSATGVDYTLLCSIRSKALNVSSCTMIA